MSEHELDYDNLERERKEFEDKIQQLQADIQVKDEALNMWQVKINHEFHCHICKGGTQCEFGMEHGRKLHVLKEKALQPTRGQDLIEERDRWREQFSHIVGLVRKYKSDNAIVVDSTLAAILFGAKRALTPTTKENKECEHDFDICTEEGEDILKGICKQCGFDGGYLP